MDESNQRHLKGRDPISCKNDQKSFSDAVIPDGVYREVILCIHNHNGQAIIGDAGFRPGRRGPFVSAKGPKTMLAVAWPFGCPARFADSGGAQTRYAQTVRALFPESAALLGHVTRPGISREAKSPLIIERWNESMACSGERTNLLRSNKARQVRRASDPKAKRKASNKGGMETKWGG